jgi:hypothetical protein
VSTLFVQGLSLGPLARLLRIRVGDADEAEEIIARKRLFEEGLARIDAQVEAGLLNAEMDSRTGSQLHFDGPAAPAPALRMAVLQAQRRELLTLFDAGQISDSVMRRLLRELDLKTALIA